MSIDLPQTLEEWKRFRFPYDDTPRPGMPGFISKHAPPRRTVSLIVPVDGDEEEKDGKGKDSEGHQGGGGPVLVLALGEEPSGVLLEDAQATDPEPPPAPVSAWAYDEARGLLIHHGDEQMVSLRRHLNTLPLVLRSMAIIEHRRRDPEGFTQALNRACLSVHGYPLRELIRRLPKGSDEPIGWPEDASEEPVLTAPEAVGVRRRRTVRS